MASQIQYGRNFNKKKSTLWRHVNMEAIYCTYLLHVLHVPGLDRYILKQMYILGTVH